jgi:hypothetical protein
MENQKFFSGLVFIVGFPRSGTTFLQSLLCTQKKIISIPETHFFTKAVGPFEKQEFRSLNVNEFLTAEKAIQEMMKFRFSKDTREDILNLVHHKELTKKVLFEILVKNYLSTTSNFDLNQKKIFIEKTPDHARKLDEITDIYPEAKIIGIFRNPLLAISSYYQNLVAYRKPYMELASIWKEVYNELIKKKRRNLHILKYEELVRNPEKEIKFISDFLEINLKTENLSNYKDAAKKHILNHETWKRQNVDGLNKRLTHSLPFFTSLKIRKYLKHEMNELGYNSNNKLLKIFYPFQFST